MNRKRLYVKRYSQLELLKAYKASAERDLRDDSIQLSHFADEKTEMQEGHSQWERIVIINTLLNSNDRNTVINGPFDLSNVRGVLGSNETDSWAWLQGAVKGKPPK